MTEIITPDSQEPLMKILILEDDAFRIQSFLEKLGRHEIVVVNSSDLCISMLERFHWDWALMDHDLGRFIKRSKIVDNGSIVANWLEANMDKYPAKGVILHSLNAVGRDNMAKAMPRAVQFPNIWNEDGQQLSLMLEQPQDCLPGYR